MSLFAIVTIVLVALLGFFLMDYLKQKQSLSKNDAIKKNNLTIGGTRNQLDDYIIDDEFIHKRKNEDLQVQNSKRKNDQRCVTRLSDDGELLFDADDVYGDNEAYTGRILLHDDLGNGDSWYAENKLGVEQDNQVVHAYILSDDMGYDVAKAIELPKMMYERYLSYLFQLTELHQNGIVTQKEIQHLSCQYLSEAERVGKSPFANIFLSNITLKGLLDIGKITPDEYRLLSVGTNEGSVQDLEHECYVLLQENLIMTLDEILSIFKPHYSHRLAIAKTLEIATGDLYEGLSDYNKMQVKHLGRMLNSIQYMDARELADAIAYRDELDRADKRFNEGDLF